MENLESIWQVGLLALLAGAMIGALAYRLFAPSLARADQLRSELEAARQELIDYKASVNSHFDKTSELVNDLTQNYVRVYQHLAEGAQTLGGSRQLNNLLEQQPGKVLLAVDEDSATEQAEPTAGKADAKPIVTDTASGASETEATEPAAEPAVKAESDQLADSEPEPAGKDRPVEEPWVSTAGNDSGQSGDRSRQADADGGAADDDAKSGEPVIDVSKIEPGSARAGKAETELGTLIRESGNDEAVKPTRH